MKTPLIDLPIKVFGKSPYAILGSLWLAFVPAGMADVRLPAIFSDHMVLQAGTPFRIWGWAEPEEQVTVEIAGRSQTTVTDSSGEWRVELQPLEHSASASTLTVRGRNTITVGDVLIGQVWLGSGQSNMQLPVSGAKDFNTEKKTARFPEIRMFTVGKHASQDACQDIKGKWEVCSPETVGNFSATLYFFGRDLHQRLDQPVGLIHSSWGGTPIQAWMPLDSLKASPNYQILNDKRKRDVAAWPEREKQIEAAIRAWEEEAAKGVNKNMRMKPGNPGKPDSTQYMPARLYNGMIHPLIDYRIRGVLWYQGEANARDGATGAEIYSDLQTRLISAFRSAWSMPDLPFLFVQLPNYDDAIDPTRMSWAFFREAQARTLAVPHTGMAVTIDIGEANDIHPKNKQDVGRRLAAIALSDIYHVDASSRSPVFLKQAISGSEVHLYFSQAEGGLVAAGGGIRGFFIAGEDRAWHPATARIDGDHVVVTSDRTPSPVAVRYGWEDNPECNLFNQAGLPVTPFRTDTWK